LAAAACNDAQAKEAVDPFVGVWECPATRPDSTMFVVYYTFSADGTVRLASGSDLFSAGYSSRGGGTGVWSATTDGRYHLKTVEILYRNQNEMLDVSAGGTVMLSGVRDVALGRFYVDATYSIRKDSAGKDTLCSGNAASNEADPCPDGSVTKLLRVNFDGTVTLPSGTLARARCRRLEDVFPTI
jgi:hypothetical protein